MTSAPSPRRLVFLNRFYWPDSPATAQLLTDLAEALAAEGRAVLVITSPPDGSDLPSVVRHNGVDVIRVYGSRRGNRRIWGQALDLATFTLSALWRLGRTLRSDDTLVILTDPPMLSVPALLIARLRGARTIQWLQDIYPEVAQLVTGRRAFSWLIPLRNWAWRHSDACVTLGRDMAALVGQSGIPPGRLHIVPNWAPEGIAPMPPAESSPLRAAWGLEGRFVVLYFGNLGRVHDLESVLEVAECLRDCQEIVVAFVGPGAQRAALEKKVHDRQLANIRFFPAQPRERRSEILALGDIHLVTLREGCERVVFPSKLYTICAAGRAVLFIGPRASEIAAVITGERLGLAFTREQTAEIAGALRRLGAERRAATMLGAAGLRFYRTHGCLARATADWHRVLRSVENPGAAA